MKHTKPRTRRLKPYEQSVRINISLPPLLVQKVPELLNKHGFVGLSDYYQARMRKDLGLDLAA